eukprot:3008347-Amphidinium_carterae.1
MACMIENKKIQRQNDRTCAEPLGLAHTPPRGRYDTRRTMHLLDMVAELAIATRASQLFTTIAWICGFCVGTISAYMEGAIGIDSDSESDDVVAM